MFSEKPIRIPAVQQGIIHRVSLGTLCKCISTSGVVLFLLYPLLFINPYYQSFKLKWPLCPNDTLGQNSADVPTSLGHIVFGIVGSMDTWRQRRAYIEAWWRPNVSRGYLFLDRPPMQEFQPWPSSSPPFRVNEDVTKLFKVNLKKLATQTRIARSVVETVRQGDTGVRWYVMADDDTVLFLDNLVEVLAKYDHSKYFYIGKTSECVKSNFNFSFDMAFGGAGYALSYPLAKALAAELDRCIEKYPVISSDLLLQTCLADFGVALTQEKGLHQIDLHGDISGLLSAHPLSPALSLHHFDNVDPLFPTMNRSASINHLMKAAEVDHSRLLQQTICYQRKSNWSFSTSWGYSVHLYESIQPRSFLRRPLETFKPWWGDSRHPFYMFNTRRLTKNPCKAPHVFFLESIEKIRGDDDNDQVVTTYARAFPRNLPPCSSSGNHSADPMSKIRVFSPGRIHKKPGEMECCDVEQTTDINVTHIKLRACFKDEIIT